MLILSMPFVSLSMHSPVFILNKKSSFPINNTLDNLLFHATSLHGHILSFYNFFEFYKNKSGNIIIYINTLATSAVFHDISTSHYLSVFYFLLFFPIASINSSKEGILFSPNILTHF